MAAPSIMEGGMGSAEDPSQETADSNESAEDWEKVTSASDNSKEGEEADEVASLDDLANFIQKCLKPLAKEIIKVLENCQERQERKVTSFAEACAQLEDVCQSCDQKDRLIIAGSGNVGKSTIANAMLGGGKFWPTTRRCMTSRICEASYDESSDGTPIDKEKVQENSSSEPLQEWHPSPLLKPDVILVDLPGLDQKSEYMERLEKYMNCHSASSVVLLYVIDVNNKIRNPDRQFFEKLMGSPWNILSQSLVLLVNKCDMGGCESESNSDEEVADYGNLLADITKEAQNYCTPTVLDLSMTDKKKNQPAAVLKWKKVEAHASNALAQLKCNRIIEILRSLENLRDLLRLVVKDDAHLSLELKRMKNHLFEADAEVQQLVDDKDAWIERRAARLRQILVERQEGHLAATLKAGVPHYNCRVFEDALQDVDKAIHLRIEAMVTNDTMFSFLALGSWRTRFAKAGVAPVLATYAILGTTTTIQGVSVAAAFSSFAFPAIVAGLATVTLVGGIMSMTLVDESYVRQRFATIYQQVIQEFPSKRGAEEHASAVERATKDLQQKRDDLQSLQDEASSRGFLDDEFKADYLKLQKKFNSLNKRCKEMLPEPFRELLISG